MNPSRVCAELAKRYPGKKITVLATKDDIATEIICELGGGLAIAVIDASQPHYHKKTTETYEVLRGDLSVFKNDEETRLHPGETTTIKPGVIHYAIGDETWVAVTAAPEWNIDDHHRIL